MKQTMLAYTKIGYLNETAEQYDLVVLEKVGEPKQIGNHDYQNVQSWQLMTERGMVIRRKTGMPERFDNSTKYIVDMLHDLQEIEFDITEY